MELYTIGRSILLHSGRQRCNPLPRLRRAFGARRTFAQPEGLRTGPAAGNASERENRGHFIDANSAATNSLARALASAAGISPLSILASRLFCTR